MRQNPPCCSPFLFPFLLSSSSPFFLFPRRRASHFPRLSTFVSLGPLTRYNVAKFNPIYFTTKLKSSQCVLDVVESPPVHSCVLIFSWCFSLFQCPPSVQGNSGRISFPGYQIFLFRACGFSLCIFLCRQMIPLQEINAKQLGNEITLVSYNTLTFALELYKLVFPVWFMGHFSIEWSWNKTGNTLNQKTRYGWYTGSTQFWRDYHLGREQLLPKGWHLRKAKLSDQTQRRKKKIMPDLRLSDHSPGCSKFW